MSREEWALWVIVAQGFVIMFFEWGVWWIKYSDRKDRRKWREAKRAAIVKKLEITQALPLILEKLSDPEFVINTDGTIPSPIFVKKEEPRA
jgi:hypothetical protein